MAKGLDMKETAVDVIIPTYNRGETILNSINSVLSQTYSNIYVYVIDDCSDDSTEEIVRSITDDRIKYFRNDKRRGANYCRNLGVKYSSAKYIAFNDSDDIWRSNKIESQMKIISEKDAMVFSPYMLHEKNKSVCMGKCSESDVANIHRRLLINNVIGTPTILITRDLFEKMDGFSEHMSRFQDWEFCLRTSDKGLILYCDDILVDAYRREDSITKKRENAVDSLYYLTEKYSEEIVKYGLIGSWIDIYMQCELSYDEIHRLLLLYDLSGNEMEELLLKSLISINSLRIKSDEYLTIIANLMSRSREIISYLKKKEVNKVCVYGNSVMGEAFGHLLIDNQIDVICYIDINSDKYCFRNVIRPDEYSVECYPDVIINTVPSLDITIGDKFSLSEVITISDLMDIKENR